MKRKKRKNKFLEKVKGNEQLTFDDILIKPSYSEITSRDVDTSV